MQSPAPPRPVLSRVGAELDMRGHWNYRTMWAPGTMEISEQDASGAFRGTYRSSSHGTLEGRITGLDVTITYKTRMIVTLRGHFRGRAIPDERGVRRLDGRIENVAGTSPLTGERQ